MQRYDPDWREYDMAENDIGDYVLYIDAKVIEDGWIKQHEDDVAENVKICALNNDLRIKLKAIAEERDALKAEIIQKDHAIKAATAQILQDKAELANAREALDTIEGMATDTTTEIQEITKAALARRRNSEYFIR
jgi:hypothetical protein